MTTSRMHRLGAGILLLGAAIAIVHLLLAAFYYPVFPPAIPAFVDAAGKPLVSLDKSPLTVLRLPLMGLAAQAACWAMWATRLKGADAWAAHRLLWASVALLMGGKLLLSSLDVLDPHHQLGFRTGVIALSGLGVLALVASVPTLYAGYRQKAAEYAGQVSRGIRLTLGLAGLAYAALVAMPWWPVH